MATVKELKERLLALQGKELEFVVEALQENEEQLLALNRQQLFEGKDSQGKDLSPTYLEDPYFKTKEAAQRYSDWKDKITPSSKRKSGVPNLYINGMFHNSIDATITVQGITTDSDAPFSSGVEGKFGTVIYGLNDEKKPILLKTVAPLAIGKIRGSLKL